MGLAYGDFQLLGFRSNSPSLAASLAGVNEEKAALPLDGVLNSHKPGAMISLGESDQIQRVLGVIWNPETDLLGFSHCTRVYT